MTEHGSFLLMETTIRSYSQCLSLSSKISDRRMKISENLRQTVTRQANDSSGQLKDVGINHKQIKHSGRPARRNAGEQRQIDSISENHRLPSKFISVKSWNSIFITGNLPQARGHSRSVEVKWKSFSRGEVMLAQLDRRAFKPYNFNLTNKFLLWDVWCIMSPLGLFYVEQYPARFLPSKMWRYFFRKEN
jgi:hypothetical protein